MPKSGSKLLFNVLRGLTRIAPFVDTGLNEIKPYSDGQPTPQSWINTQLDTLGPGDVRFGYLYAHPDSVERLCRPGWAPFLILRDPRDVVVSEVFYATEMHPGHALHETLRALPDLEARIAVLIGGIPSGSLRRVDIRGQFERFLPWLERSELCVVRFEDLILDRVQVLRRVLHHVTPGGLDPKGSSDPSIEVLEAQAAPAKSETFREGQAGGWSRHFSPSNKDQFKEVAGDLLIRLGYESGSDW